MAGKLRSETNTVSIEEAGPSAHKAIEGPISWPEARRDSEFAKVDSALAKIMSNSAATKPFSRGEWLLRW